MLSSLGFSAFLTPPPANAALSGIFGSISLTAWICLLVPQLITNYKTQSADALSMGFLFIWFAGDVSNLSGALFTNLAPTAIVLASYFCLVDVVLISQCTYYNTKNARLRRRGRRRASHGESSATETEHSPLLGRQRSTSAGRRGEPDRDAPKSPAGGEVSEGRAWLNNALALLAVWVVGALGWFVSYKFGAWDVDAPAGAAPAPEEVPTHMIGTVLGYISAAFYLCARIPQIIKNSRDKSCEGLALLFFLLSLTGNLAYGLSLLTYSQDRDYLLTALPWLIGSLGTMVEDSIIFVQFRIYSNNGASREHSAS